MTSSIARAGKLLSIVFICGTYPIKAGFTSLGDLPNILTSPESNFTKPNNIFMNVVLPAPFGPTIETKEPSGTMRFKFSKTFISP